VAAACVRAVSSCVLALCARLRAVGLALRIAERSLLGYLLLQAFLSTVTHPAKDAARLKLMTMFRMVHGIIA
jgi:hypothetical protein